MAVSVVVAAPAEAGAAVVAEALVASAAAPEVEAAPVETGNNVQYRIKARGCPHMSEAASCFYTSVSGNQTHTLVPAGCPASSYRSSISKVASRLKRLLYKANLSLVICSPRE